MARNIRRHRLIFPPWGKFGFLNGKTFTSVGLNHLFWFYKYSFLVSIGESWKGVTYRCKSVTYLTNKLKHKSRDPRPGGNNTIYCLSWPCAHFMKTTIIPLHITTETGHTSSGWVRSRFTVQWLFSWFALILFDYLIFC